MVLQVIEIYIKGKLDRFDQGIKYLFNMVIIFILNGRSINYFKNVLELMGLIKVYFFFNSLYFGIIFF